MRLFNRRKCSLAEYGFFVFFAVAVMLSYFCLFTPISVEIDLYQAPHRDMTIAASCPYPDMMQLFYASQNGTYGEKKSQHWKIKAAQTTYQFIVGNYKIADSLKFGHRLRFDPLMYGGDFYLRQIVIHQPGYLPIRISRDNGFKLLQPLHDIGSMELREQGMIIHSTGCDPQLEMLLDSDVVTFDFAFLAKVVAATVTVSSLLYFLLFLFTSEGAFSLVPGLMAFVLALIFAMAALNSGIIHPDEVVHLRAGHYYEHHWIPPRICAPETMDSYSVFGVSRLDSFEISYLFAGKFARFLNLFSIDDLHRIRYFNVLLFLLFALMCGKFVEMRLMGLSLLVSPQIWYLYSYCNSDAFALSVITLLGYQVIAEKSMTNRFLIDPIRNRSAKLKAVAVCLLFSLLLFLKLNYYIFILFLGLILLYRLFSGYYSDTSLVLRRVMVIALVAAALFGLRWGLDVGLNGLHRNVKRQECREQRAGHMFNPATPLAQRYPFLRMKERQIPLRDLFEKHNWGFKSFVHFFGVYYFTPQADIGFFKFFMAALTGFGLFIIGSICLHRQWSHLVLLLIVLSCSSLLVALSLWNSWIASFQAQGRYLFPVLTMTAVLVAEMRSYVNRKILCGFVLLFFFVSVYSFVFVGMRQLLA